jgi:hypothetical protein
MGSTDEIDAFMVRVDDLLLDGKFAEVDAELESLDIPATSTLFLMSYLILCAGAFTAPRGPHPHLKSFIAFRDRVIEEMKRREPDRWDSLVGGLDGRYVK